MNEELKQIAIKAKELGFKARTVTTIHTDTIHTEKYLLGGKNVMLNDMCFYLYLCDLQEWLRSKYNLNIDIILIDCFNYDYYIVEKDICNNLGDPFETYQEALQEGIKESLKLIKT